LGPRRLASLHPPLPQNNRIHTLDSSKTEALREQFDTAFTDEDLSSIPSLGISPCDSMPNIHISLQGVKKQQENIAVSKACGPDLISARVLNEAASELAHILTEIFQQSLHSGKLPLAWKDANVPVVHLQKRFKI